VEKEKEEEEEEGKSERRENQAAAEGNECLTSNPVAWKNGGEAKVKQGCAGS
jgi:hypothetical protein